MVNARIFHTYFSRILLVVFVFCSIATIAYAQNGRTVIDMTNPRTVVDTGTDGDTGAGGGGVARIANPLGENSTVTSFFLQIIEILLIFAVPIIVLFIIISGFNMVTAQGDTTKLTQSKRAFLFAIIGGLLILGAFVILEVIQGTVNSFIQ
jgi:hypothetical protein